MKTKAGSSNVGAGRHPAKHDERSTAVVLPQIEHTALQSRIADVNVIRHAQIAEAAYYRAEKRGFVPGCEFEDWLAAEQEVNEKSRQL